MRKRAWPGCADAHYFDAVVCVSFSMIPLSAREIGCRAHTPVMQEDDFSYGVLP